jgi:hypothetical protein
VVGQQISPDPSGNTQPNAVAINAGNNLPGNGPTLWGRFISTGIGKGLTAAVILAAIVLVFRQFNKRLVVR